MQPAYIGRFAPSPTGPLHLGSLFTALASYLDARAHRGKWLLRIDDLDTPRNQPGSVPSILTTLETFGLHWDDSIYYQSQHLDDYAAYLGKLTEQGLTYRCECSRKTLAELLPSSTQDQLNQAHTANPEIAQQARLLVAEDHNQNQGDINIYPGICRNKTIPDNVPYATRIKTDERTVVIEDGLQGQVSHNLAQQDGDFILKRKDGIIAYQFAVVIDDHLQSVSHVMRGCDLLAETPKQIYLQQLLGFPTPAYQHVPILVDKQGHKLSKQTLATAVDTQLPNLVLFELLLWLKQNPPDDLIGATANELLDWAINHWQAEVLSLSSTISLI